MNLSGTRIAAGAFCLAALLPLAARAQAPVPVEGRSTVVVELFTSQGCSLCPPADGFFATLADRDDVIPLALHVDYWDYIGWPDHFASPEFTARQKRYARANGSNSVYTPQLVVEGSTFMGGAQAMLAANSIFDEREAPDAALVAIARAGDYLNIDLAPNPVLAARQSRDDAPPAAGDGQADVYVVRYIPEAAVDIKRGENAGKTIHYRNIVTEFRNLGTWDAQHPLKIEAHVTGDLPIVVIVQTAGQGPILGAAALR